MNVAAAVARADQYVAKHGRCCACYSDRHGCSSHGQAPKAGPLSDDRGPFVWYLLPRTVGQQATRIKHYL